MGKKNIQEDIQPIEKWDTTQWEAAYNLLNSKFDRLKNKMRLAMQELSNAQKHLSESVI